MSSSTALLVIDVQANLFDPAHSVHGADELLARLTDLVERFRGARAPIVFIRNNGGPTDPDRPGTPGWELHAAMRPTADDIVLDKDTEDAFGSTVLDEKLKAAGVSHVVIAGLQSEYCVRDTTLGALARGYRVTLASDSHSTYDGDGQTAPEKSAAVNAELRGRVTLAAAAEIAVR